MDSLVLITGGAGFIGSHVGDELLRNGYRVRALDAMVGQVHQGATRPEYLSNDVELVVADVRDPAAVSRALVDVDVVVHLAAAVGVGQSMHEVSHYASSNAVGTAVLMEALARRSIRRLVVASSMSVYGEGLYRDVDERIVADVKRDPEKLAAGSWDPVGPSGHTLEPMPTPESKKPSLQSVYALSKYDQEVLCLMLGAAYEIPTVALRLFNVFGTRQSLSNPYTGVLAIFASRLINGRRPLIFEDGLQRRDFVHVSDVARAFHLAMDEETPAGEVFNVGSGVARTVLDVARQMATLLDAEDLTPELAGTYRVGDVRHCTADIGRARQLMGYEPMISLEDGLAELTAWLEGQVARDDVDSMHAELVERGLAR